MFRIRERFPVVALAFLLSACSFDTGERNGAPKNVPPRSVPAAAAPSTVDPAPAPPAAVQANSADRILFWVNCYEAVSYSDAQLDKMRSWGVDGFVCMTQWLHRMGGPQAYTGDLARATGESYSFQRNLRDSRLTERARTRGMALYLGFYLVNSTNVRTPLGEWFDDSAWDETVLPSIGNIAAAARALGFAGLAVDQELYGQTGGVTTASWSWKYPENARSESETREAARRRGEQVMGAILGGFPKVDLISYGARFPEAWEDVVNEEVNDKPDANRDGLDIDFWNGMSSVEGYDAIRFWNALFYKTPHVRGSTWDTAFQYEYNNVASLFSRRFSNWAYASAHVSESPFVWIDAGPSSFERARSPAEVADQLSAVRTWGMGRAFGNFLFSSVEKFDYRPYADALRAASAEAVVDAEPPELRVDEPRAGGAGAAARVTLRGTATDNFAVWAVRWRTDSGAAGAATMRWRPLSGNARAGWKWEMAWEARDVPLHQGANTVTFTAIDTKGLARAVTWTATGR